MKCAVLQIIIIICVTHVQKIFKIQALIKQLLTKYQIFTILPQISHFHKYRNFSSIFCNFLDQLLHSYKFHGRDMSGIVLFFIFASCHPLKLLGQELLCNAVDAESPQSNLKATPTLR